MSMSCHVVTMSCHARKFGDEGVVEYLQDYMISPIAVKAKDMPSGDVAWNNFPSVLYTAHAVYCALEGLIHLISHTSFT